MGSDDRGRKGEIDKGERKNNTKKVKKTEKKEKHRHIIITELAPLRLRHI